MSFGFSIEQGQADPRAFTSQRFETVPPTVFPGGLPVELVRTSTNSAVRSEQRFVLKSIRARCFLAACLNTQARAPIIAIWHTYTFRVTINQNQLVYPVAFKWDADEQYSDFYMSAYDAGVNNLTVSVTRDSIPPAFALQPVTLALIFDGWLF